MAKTDEPNVDDGGLTIIEDKNESENESNSPEVNNQQFEMDSVLSRRNFDNVQSFPLMNQVD